MRLKQKLPINKTFFIFHPILMKPSELVVSICVQLHQVSTKLDQTQKSFMKGLYICFYSVTPYNNFVIFPIISFVSNQAYVWIMICNCDFDL